MSPQDALQDPRAAPPAKRVLLLTSEDLADANEVPEPIRPLIEEAEDIYVIAPTLTTWLQWVATDVDRARVSADKRLRRVFNHMHADGLAPRGTVADENQVVAIADALLEFDADLIVLRLHARAASTRTGKSTELLSGSVPISTFRRSPSTSITKDRSSGARRPRGQRQHPGRRSRRAVRAPRLTLRGGHIGGQSPQLTVVERLLYRGEELALLELHVFSKQATELCQYRARRCSSLQSKSAQGESRRARSAPAQPAASVRPTAAAAKRGSSNSSSTRK